MKLRAFQLQAVADLNAAMSVEGKRDRLVRFRRKRAERHRAADEMLHDGIN